MVTRDPQLANRHPAGNAVLKLISARAPRICTEIQETRLFLQKLKKLLEVPLRVETQGRRHQKSEKGVSVVPQKGLASSQKIQRNKNAFEDA